MKLVKMLVANGSVVVVVRRLMLVVIFVSSINVFHCLAQLSDEQTLTRNDERLADDDRIVDDRSSLLKDSSLLYGVFSEIADKSDGDRFGKCVDDVRTVLDGIRRRQVWAMKRMLLSIYLVLFGVFLIKYI